MKQTAIEWFAEKDTESTIQFLEGKLNQIQLAIEKTKCLQQAKEMEKEQQMKTWTRAIDQTQERAWNVVRAYDDFDDYYNETYGK